MSTQHRLRIDANADFDLSIRWLNDDGDEWHTLTDAAMQVRLTEDSDDTILDASVGAGTITLESEGWAHIHVPQADLASVSRTQAAVYDIILTDSAGLMKRILEGAAVVSRGVTRV